MNIATAKTWDDRPNNGQFIATWEYPKGEIWSATYAYIGGELRQWDDNVEVWTDASTLDLLKDITFITL